MWYNHLPTDIIWWGFMWKRILGKLKEGILLKEYTWQYDIE